MGEGLVEAAVAAATWPGLGWGFSLWVLHLWLRRKLSARLQYRVGPRLAGPRGLLQQLYDFLKQLFREEIVPEGASPVLSGALLVWAVALAGFPLVLVPWAGWSPAGFRGDVVAAVAALGMVPALLYLVAVQPRGPFSVAGGFRLLGLSASADIVFAASVLASAAAAGCWSLGGCPGRLPSGGPLSWAAWLLAAAAGAVALYALGERGLFSQPEAETEVAGGFLSDLSGRQLAYAMLADGLHWVSGVYLYLAAVLHFPAPRGLLGVAAWVAAGLAVEALYCLVDALVPRLRLVEAERLLWLGAAPLAFAALLAGLAGGG